MGIFEEGCTDCFRPATILCIGDGKCRECAGTGYNHLSECEACGGNGKCPTCDGSGKC